MKRKGIVLLTIIMAFGLILVGCNRGTPEEQATKVEQDLANAKAVEGRLEGEIKLSGFEMDLTTSANLNVDTKLDFSQKTPVVDLNGEISTMGFKTDFELFMNEKILYMKAMDSEEVLEIDDDVRSQISSVSQMQASGLGDVDREIERSYENNNQLLSIRYNTAQLNEKLKNAIEGATGVQNSQEQADDLLDFTEPIRKDPYDEFQFVFDQYEMTYVLDGYDTLKEVRGSISCYVIYDYEMVNVKCNFTYRIDKLGESLDIKEPDYTTTTRRSRTTTTTDRMILDEELDENIDETTERETEQTTQIRTAE